MKIFISWSGEFSQAAASLLKKYIPAILQGVEPFMSAHDIKSGTRWAPKLAEELEATHYGILCLTPTNLESSWLIFEAGALSKFEDSAACGLLFGQLKPTDVKNPLSQFQHRRFERDDFQTLLQDINARTERPLKSEQFKLLFDTLWPKIEADYASLLKVHSASSNSTHSKRTELDLLEEILFRLRGIERNPSPTVSAIELSPEQLLDSRLSAESVRAYTQWKFPGMGISEVWQSQLLNDIRIQDYPTVRHLDSAVGRALPAVHAFKEKHPDLFPTGTDYITKALGFADKNFRTAHSWALVTSEAFAEYAHLIKEP